MSAATEPSNPTIRTLLLCDLVASTKLVERIGDAAAADLLARHDRIARDLLADLGGREIDKSDGFLQAGMPELRNDPRFVPLCARLGLVELWVESGRWPDCPDEVPYDFRAACAAAKGVPRDPVAPSAS